MAPDSRKYMERRRFCCEVAKCGFGRVRSCADHGCQSVQGTPVSRRGDPDSRWYLRCPLAYEHVSELLTERGVPVDASCVWRWVQAYAPELNKRCRRHLKFTNKSYRI